MKTLLLVLIMVNFHEILCLSTDEDEPLFISLVADLFPNQMLEKTSYPSLEASIAEQVEEAGLIYHPPWVLKLIQVIFYFYFVQLP